MAYALEVRMLVHAQTVVRGLLRELGLLSRRMEKVEERLFGTLLDKSLKMGEVNALTGLFEDKQSLTSALEGLYAAKLMLESLDSMMGSVEQPRRISLLLSVTLRVLEEAGEALSGGHEAEGLFLKIVRAELLGLIESSGVEVPAGEEVETIVDNIVRGAVQQAKVEVQKRTAALPLPPSAIGGSLGAVQV